MKSHTPPRLFLRFFRWYCHPKMRDYIEGDLMEVYGVRLNKLGKRKADIKFIIDVLLLFRPGIIRSAEEYKNLNNTSMLKNYVKISWRTIVRNKGYSFINITGLAVGIAASILLFLVVQFELSFDTFHKKKDRIYQVVTEFNRETVSYGVGLPFALPEGLRTDFPQLENVGVICSTGGGKIDLVDNGPATDKRFKEDTGLFYADPQFLDIFDFPLLAGDPKTVISEPNTVILTQALARKYFGDWKNCIGKLIRFDNEKEISKITGVLKDIPANSDFPIKMLFSMKTLENQRKKDFSDWESTRTAFTCYVLLPPNVSSAQINNLMPAFVKKHKEPGSATHYIRPLADLHFDTRFGNYNHRTISKEMIGGLSLIGIILIVIACVNFINLATAQAANRSKEVGIRKTLGSSRSQLTKQFLLETTLITFFALVAAAAISVLALPFLNQLLSLSLVFNIFTNTQLLVFLVAVATAVIILSGFYPSMVLSGFNPIVALKSKIGANTDRGLSLRKGLAMIQFGIAQVLIITTIVIVSQMNFIQNASLGFDSEAILNVPIPTDSISLDKIDVLRNELEQLAGVKDVSFCYSSPTEGYSWRSGFRFDGSTEETKFATHLKWADANYFKTYAIQLIAGRIYSPSDTVREFVVNETLIKKLGIKDPEDALNKEINLWDGEIKARIVGVVKDFHVKSLKEEIPPVLCGPKKNSYETIGIKFATTKINPAMASIERIWRKTFPDFIYEQQFVDEKIASLYAQEQQLLSLYKIFASIAIFISLLGMYGLASFMTVQRTKEVGIRKVLGATVTQIWALLSSEFILMVIIPLVAAAPFGYYLMRDWLQNFQYHIEISWWIFLVTGLGALVITLLVVSFQTIKAALMNPVKSMRSE